MCVLLCHNGSACLLVSRMSRQMATWIHVKRAISAPAFRFPTGPLSPLVRCPRRGGWQAETSQGEGRGVHMKIRGQGERALQLRKNGESKRSRKGETEGERQQTNQNQNPKPPGLPGCERCVCATFVSSFGVDPTVTVSQSQHKPHTHIHSSLCSSRPLLSSRSPLTNTTPSPPALGSPPWPKPLALPQ